MKGLFLVALFTLCSCASRYNMLEIERRIQLAEDRQWNDIQADVKTLIENHPELTELQKSEVSKALLEGFERHRKLKIQERSAVNLLLRATLDSNESEATRKGFQKRLGEIYLEKVTNLEGVINSVATPLRTLPPEEPLEKDLGTLMREFP